MRKFALMLGALMLTVSMVAVAQSVNDDFGSMRGWTAGPGDWVVRGGRMVQQDAGEPLARADRMVTQQGEYELEFSIRYVDGGYSSMSDMQNGIYHAGFGIQIGVENPALGRSSWGAGNSYLLWLNLDTRPSTRATGRGEANWATQAGFGFDRGAESLSAHHATTLPRGT